MTHSHTLTLAKTIFGEARGDYHRTTGGLASLIAIGNVVMNRVAGSPRYGHDITSVCLKPYQFSCWNPKDPNRVLLESDHILKSPTFQKCLWVACNVANHRWPDLTKGSNHYHATSINPKWASVDTERIRIGGHVFHKL